MAPSVWIYLANGKCIDHFKRPFIYSVPTLSYFLVRVNFFVSIVDCAITIIGDIFDEGQWSSRSEFDNYSKRFDALFAVDENTRRIVLAGNHDIGFHYE
jgi:hypothetical protein